MGESCTDGRGQDWRELMPGGEETPAQRRRADRRERDALRSALALAHGRIDVLEGEIATMRRERSAEYERGVQTGNRQRGVPSILFAGGE